MSASTLSAPPPPSDVPWWGALILAISTAIVSVIGTIFWLRGQSAPGAPPGMGVLFTDIVTFIPHILILFGVFADIFTLQGVYSIPSLIGLLALPLHFALGFLWTGVTTVLSDAYRLAMTVPQTKAPALPPLPAKGGAMSAWSGCEIYGFEGLKSPYAPQGLVVTATIFWYYLVDLLMHRSVIDSAATITAFAVFFGLEVGQLKSCDDLAGSVVLKSVIALVEGLIIGGTGYGIVQSSAPNRLPSYVLPQAPPLSSMKKNANGTYTARDGTIYILGPDGRPLPQSFFTNAAASVSAQDAGASAAAAFFGGATETSCAGSLPRSVAATTTPTVTQPPALTTPAAGSSTTAATSAAPKKAVVAGAGYGTPQEWVKWDADFKKNPTQSISTMTQPQINHLLVNGLLK